MTGIKERPILFSAPMVRAILEGRKTVTRRAIKVQPHIDVSGNFCVGNSNYGQDGYGNHVTKHFVNGCCPYGKPGDRLWVRETFVIESNRWADDPYSPPHKDGRPIQRYEDDKWDQPHYKATDSEPELWYDNRDSPGCRWKPSIHMPRWASRILLEITDVRVERLQDISDEQAQAEGIIPVPKTTEGSHQFWRNYHLSGDGTFCVRTPKESFKSLWCHVAGGSFPKGEAAYKASPHSWDANPWVWVVEFKRVTP